MSEHAQPTQALVERATLGDDAARHELLERFRDYLRRMVACRLDRRLAPRIDASDIVQETLADAAHQLDGYLENRPVPFVGWLRALANVRIRHAHRQHVFAQRRSVYRESRTPEFTDESAAGLMRQLAAQDTSPSNRLMRQEQYERVKEALASLSATDREVLAMRYAEQLSMAEIAEALGISEAGVKTRHLRAVIRLRGLLEPES